MSTCAWETYYQQLSSARRGHAVWNADPGEEPAVEIADVGYMEMGAFIRLFNASKEIGDTYNKFGTPEGYEPIDVGPVRHGTLSAIQPVTSKTVRERRIAGGVSGGSMVQSGGGFAFECTEEPGAALMLRQDAHSIDTLDEITFARYVRDNHSKWLKFANDVHRRGISADELLIVTGCDKASSQWLGVAFFTPPNEVAFEFQVGNAGVAQGGVSVWGSWNHLAVQAGPSSQTNSHNQCVFLRGYKLCDRPSMRRRMGLILRKKPLDDGFMHLHPTKGDDNIRKNCIYLRAWTYIYRLGCRVYFNYMLLWMLLSIALLMIVSIVCARCYGGLAARIVGAPRGALPH
ncbi:hypothetical protein JB92DRAFT_2886182 [Gautieria morchelliformis]|nr:hypothetical protein JB92DRAFT_2886182 [Gautieria morchelliformis]